jgi:hypothetical protein
MRVAGAKGKMNEIAEKPLFYPQITQIHADLRDYFLIFQCFASIYQMISKNSKNLRKGKSNVSFNACITTLAPILPHPLLFRV